MVQKDEHLYILCGTNRTMYSMSVYQIHLPTWTCTLLGDAWNQMDWLDDGRLVRGERAREMMMMMDLLKISTRSSFV